MSNSQQRGAYEDAQNFDTSPMQFTQQQPFDQQQFLSQIQQQPMQQFLQQQKQMLNESQFGNQSMTSGRFGVQTPAESFRGQIQQTQAQMLNAQMKPGYQANLLSQYSSVLNNSAPIERDVQQSFNFQQQQQPQQQLFGGSNMVPAQQANILQDYILKLHQQSQQMVPSPMAHTPTIHPQAPLPQQPSFGQGFLHAYQILENIQKLQQPQIPQSMNMSISEPKTPSIPQTPVQQYPNLAAIQQLANMNTSLNQHQQAIEQIEKLGMTGSQTVSQGTAFSSRPQQIQMQSQPQQPYSYLNSTSQSILNQTLGQLQTQLPSQSDLIRQPLKTSQQNYPSDDQLATSSINDTYNRYGLNQSKANMDVKHQQQQEQENSRIYQQVNDGYSFDLAKNTVSKERTYNPQSYAGGYQYGAKPQQQNDDFGYEDGGFSQQRSPKGSVKQPGRKMGEGGSPKNSWSSYPNKISAQQQEPLSYLNSNNNPYQRDGRNSPMRQSSGRFQNDGGMYVHDLESSFRNNNANAAAFNQMSNSHNSSSLNHEYQMNSQNNQNYKQQPNERQQYSPAGSNYRFDDNQNDMVNQSLNFGKSQRMPGYQQPLQTNNPNSTNGAINIDDIPIGGGRPKTFEQLLEENLRKMGSDSTPISDSANLLEDDESRPQQKKNFLKRKSQKAPNAVTVKKYGYYVDNFSEEGTKKPRERSFAPGSTQSGLLKNEDIPSTSSNVFKKEDVMEAHITPAARSVSPLNENANNDKYTEGEKNNKSAVKKRFLTRGSGTAGGKQGHGIPKQGNRQKKKAANLMSDDDQYPNDYNFAAEQDNKSPKLPHPQGQYPVSRQTAVNRRNLEDQLNRDSITEFEKLEQEVTLNMNNHPVSSNAVLYASKPQEKKKPISQPAANTNKRRKKLFDDSDSDNDDDEEVDETHHQKEEEKVLANDNQPQEDQPAKSSIVKKFFYKEDSNKQQKPALQQRETSDTTSAATEHLERVMRQKMEQLDKTIEAYNQQKESAGRLKKEYEQLLNKQRTEFRDFEGKKKKEMEDFEKLKVEELEKLKKEKKLLEQRQKNLQMVGQSNKKEREEIEALKLQLTRVQEESKLKEIKQKSTVDRLQKQVDELKQKNKELQDELNHVGEMLKMTQQQQTKQVSNQAQHQNQTNSQAQAASRYTFSSNGGNGNNVNKSVESVQSQQQQNQQQPKGILKNKNEERPESTQMFYQPNNNEVAKKHDHNENDDEVNEQDQDYKENAAAADSDEDHYKNESSNEKYHNKEEDAAGTAAAEDTEDFDMKFPAQYHNKSTANQRVLEQVVGHDGKVQRVYENGKKEVVFNNGVRREVFPDGYTIVYFNNNDIKQTYPDQKVVYYFAEAKTTQTTFADGLQVFKFANNQIEKHFPDGTKEIIFPDGTIKCIFADGEEESIFPDGTIQRIEKNGVKAIEFANGQKDILFPDGTRIREYPDGRVRKTFPDGTQENTYRQ